MEFIYVSFLLLFVFQVQAAYFLMKSRNTLLQRVSRPGENTTRTPPTGSTDTTSVELASIPILEDTTNEPKTVQTKNDGGQVLQIKRHPAKKSTVVLKDASDKVMDVQPERTIAVTNTSPQGQPVLQMGKQFEELFKKREYNEIFELGRKTKPAEFMKQLCPLVKTFDQYKRLAIHLRQYNMMVPFYLHGNFEVVKGAIIAESRIYENDNHYNKEGNLEVALSQALREDDYDRVIEFLNARKEITAKGDKQLTRNGKPTSFGWFMYHFLVNFLPLCGCGMALKRLLTFCGDGLRRKYPEMLDSLCHELLKYLEVRLPSPEADGLFIDLRGQPSLLTSTTFINALLPTAGNDYPAFIKYGWTAVIEEALKKKYENGGEKLWQAMQKQCPHYFDRPYPSTKAELAAVLKQFSAKQKFEGQWSKKNVKVLYDKIESLKLIFNIIPKVLWYIITEYAAPH